MIDLYYWPTPNGHKITIFLEEANLAYKLIPINITIGDQFEKKFLQISPNNKMPAIVDHSPADGGEPISLFESGAILMYLADKIKQFIPQSVRERFDVIQWLFWQTAGLGPMAGQNNHFSNYASEKIPYAINRYVHETARLYLVLDHQLKRKEYIAGNYSIADMASYPWIVPYESHQQNLSDYPHLQRWFKQMAARPAVQKAYDRSNEINKTPTLSDEAKKVLFNQDLNQLRHYYEQADKQK